MPKDQDSKEEFDKIKSEHPKGDYLDSIIKQIEAERIELKADSTKLKANIDKFGKILDRIEELDRANPEYKIIGKAKKTKGKTSKKS